MKIRKTLLAGAVFASLAGGAIGGTVLAPGVSGAQETPDSTAPSDSADESTEAPRPRGHHCGGRHLEAAAEALGMEVADLREALQGGQTIAQVAESRGVDVQTVIDALVAGATEKIDQAVTDGRLTAEEAAEKKADLPERMTAIVNGERPPGGPFGGRGPGPRPPLEDAAA